jgi:ferredoxin
LGQLPKRQQNESALGTTNFTVNDAKWVLRENVSEKEYREYYAMWDFRCGGEPCTCCSVELEGQAEKWRSVHLLEKERVAGDQ